MAFRVAVIGLGLMGRRMLDAMGRHPLFDVVVGHDRDGEVARRCAAAGGFAVAERADLALTRGDVDLVYIATPPAAHVPQALAALEHGLPVFVEKPLCVDPRAAEQLVSRVEGSGLVSAINFPLATLPGVRRIARDLADGTAGRPIRVEVTLHFASWPRAWHHAGAWLRGREEGGFVREVFSHFAFLTQRFLGPLELVDGSLAFEAGASCETRAQARFVAGGVPVSLVGGVGGAAPDFNRWTLFCAARSYRVEDWSHVSRSDGTSWSPVTPEEGEAPGLASQLDELAALLSGRPSVLPTLRDGWTVVQAVEALHDAGD